MKRILWLMIAGGLLITPAFGADRAMKYPTGMPVKDLTVDTIIADGGGVNEIGATDFTGDVDVDGNMTADYYIGNGSLLTGIASGYTNLTQFLTQTAWRLFYSDGSGDVKELTLGADGEYLKSNGATSAPTWATPTGGAHDAVTVTNTTDIDLVLSTQALTAFINATLKANWNAAYGWGNHSAVGYLTAETDPAVGTHESTYNHSLIATALQAESDPAVGTHESTYNHSLIATALQAESDPAVGTHESSYNHSLIATALQSFAEVDPTVDTSGEIVAIIGASVYQPYDAGIINSTAIKALSDLTNYYNKTAANSEFINATEMDLVNNLDNYYNRTETAALDSDTLTNFYNITEADAEFLNSTEVEAIDSLTNYYNITAADSEFLNSTEGNAAYLNDDGDTGTGAYDFGGASDFEIPNGASPTTDTAGQIAVRTGAASAGGFQLYGAASTFYPAYYSKSCFVYNLTDADDIPLWKTPIAVTIRAIHAVCTVGAANMTLGEYDANGANGAVVDNSWMAVTSTNTNDDGSLSNPSIDANDWVGIIINNCTANSTLAVTWEYTYD